jgi:uncharacterized protein (TIGR02246 family)
LCSNLKDSKRFLRLRALVIVLFFGAINLFFIAPASIASQAPRSFTLKSLMTPEAIRLVIQKAADSWVTGNVEEFANLFTPHGELITPGHLSVGPEEIQKTSKAFYDTYHQVKIKIINILIENEKAAVEWIWQDVEKLTNKSSQADDVIMVDFRDGKICRWREYIDTASNKN